MRGQVGRGMIGTDGFEETGVFGVTLSLTKWSRLVRTIDKIPAVIAEGFHWARSGRPGPVVIDIPTDILKAKTEFSGPAKFTPHARTSSDHVGTAAPSTSSGQAPGCPAERSSAADAAIALLNQATRPVALVLAAAHLSARV